MKISTKRPGAPAKAKSEQLPESLTLESSPLQGIHMMALYLPTDEPHSPRLPLPHKDCMLLFSEHRAAAKLPNSFMCPGRCLDLDNEILSW